MSFMRVCFSCAHCAHKHDTRLERGEEGGRQEAVREERGAGNETWGARRKGEGETGGRGGGWREET